MTSLSVLIPVSVLLIAIAIAILVWAVRSGQYEDLDKPGHSILFDDDRGMIPDPDDKKDA